MRFTVTAADETLPVEVAGDAGRYRVRVGDAWLEVEARIGAAGPWSLLVDGVPYLADLADDGDETLVTVGDEIHRVRVQTEGPGARGRGRRGAGEGGQRLSAPMPGRVVAVHVGPGDRVEPGTPLVVLEAMKMENEFAAAVAGVVAEVCVSPGQAVNAGDLLMVVAPGIPPEGAGAGDRPPSS
jgi:3-methylcrotonyl-CoA carboxylase alpha subunit